ncbi:MAG TPA: hypothetical protein VMH87_00850 [Pseudomonadales bacterium]|nr:hypothetical protein [Pseudomonadales bacterium]
MAKKDQSQIPQGSPRLSRFTGLHVVKIEGDSSLLKANEAY